MMTSLDQAHRDFPDISEAMLQAELGRESGMRRRTYPARVQKGRMTQAEADHQLAMGMAWLEDMERRATFFARCRAAWQGRAQGGNWSAARPAPASHGLSWQLRREALRREIGMRRRFYPDWIGTGRMTQDDGDHRIACLEALAAIYDDGFDWTASNGARPQFANIAPTAAMEQARAELLQHAAAIEAARIEPERQAQLAI